MQPWVAAGLGFEVSKPTEKGVYWAKNVTPGTADLQLSVTVRNASGLPLGGIGVLFGFHTGDSYPVPPMDYWNKWDALVGNLQYTDGSGTARHTAREKGTEIFIVDYQYEDGAQIIARSSDVFSEIPLLTNPPGQFDHTGIHVDFVQFTPGVLSQAQINAWFEERIAALEAEAGPAISSRR
jgi:hypothetical protein